GLGGPQEAGAALPGPEGDPGAVPPGREGLRQLRPSLRPFPVDRPRDTAGPGHAANRATTSVTRASPAEWPDAPVRPRLRRPGHHDPVRPAPAALGRLRRRTGVSVPGSGRPGHRADHAAPVARGRPGRPAVVRPGP